MDSRSGPGPLPYWLPFAHWAGTRMASGSFMGRQRLGSAFRSWAVAVMASVIVLGRAANGCRWQNGPAGTMASVHALGLFSAVELSKEAVLHLASVSPLGR